MVKKTARPVFVRASVSFLIGVLICAALMALGQPSAALTYETAVDFRYPLDPGGWFMGQAFGVWNSQRSGYHLAEDLLPSDMRTELPVFAPANGYIRHSGFQSGYGYVLVIEHRLPDNSYVCSVLGHLKAANLVPRGTEVVKGQFVGRISAHPVENGGYNFAHLHFGVRSGAYSTVRDPDGGWRYRGYAAGPAIRALWHNPMDFVNSRNTPAPVPQTGSVSVQLNPREAVDAGAQWRLSGTNAWRSSGETVSQIPAGSHTVEFKNVSGWDRPEKIAITIQNGLTTTAFASYIQQSSPVLGVSPSSLSFGRIRVGRYASPRSYIVAGANLHGSVVIQAPAGYWISTAAASGYSRSLVLQPNNGTVYQRIHVSFLPTRTGSISGSITHASPGAAARAIRVSGWGY